MADEKKTDEKKVAKDRDYAVVVQEVKDAVAALNAALEKISNDKAVAIIMDIANAKKKTGETFKQIVLKKLTKTIDL